MWEWDQRFSILGGFFGFFDDILGFVGNEWGLEKKQLVESIELIELDLESALVDLESRHVRLGPAFFSILGGFVRFSDDILGFVGRRGVLEKK